MPAYLKIGFTKSGYAAQRCHEQKACHSDLVLLKETTEVPFPQRVEQLIFKELLLHRRYQDCGTDGKQHTEWFEISLEQAERVIQRWANWMNRDPYGASRKLKEFWKKQVNKRSEKFGKMTGQRPIAVGYIPDMNAAYVEKRMAGELDDFTRSGFDPKCPSKLMEWCVYAKIPASKRC